MQWWGERGDWQILICLLQGDSGGDGVDVPEGETGARGKSAQKAVAIVQARLEQERKLGFPAIHCWYPQSGPPRRQGQNRPGVPLAHPGCSITLHHGSNSYI